MKLTGLKLTGFKLTGPLLACALLAACSSSTEPLITPATVTYPASSSSASTQPSISPSSAPASVSPSSTTPSTVAAPSTSTNSTPRSGQSLAGVTVLLDPGHNGGNVQHAAQINALVDAGGFQKACNTTGTENRRQTEADFTWQLSARVRARLEQAGATVVLTRNNNTGWGPCIDERGKLAPQVGANYLVSLHADGAAPTGHGFHIIHPGLRAGYTDQIVGPSAALATALRDRLVASGMATSTYLGQAGLDERTDIGTLNWARVPAVMLEAGNMANPDDAAFLASDQGQERIAAAVVSALEAQP